MIKKWNNFITESNDVTSPLQEVETLLLEFIDDETLTEELKYYFDGLKLCKTYKLNINTSLDKSNIANYIEFYKSMEHIMKYLESTNSDCGIELEHDYLMIFLEIKDEKYTQFFGNKKGYEITKNMTYTPGVYFKFGYYSLDLSQFNKKDHFEFPSPYLNIVLGYEYSKIIVYVEVNNPILKSDKIQDFIIEEISSLGLKFRERDGSSLIFE